MMNKLLRLITFSELLWKAPELLRNRNSPPRGSQKGDVYSFGLILINIHGRAGPWGSTGMTAKGRFYFNCKLTA